MNDNQLFLINQIDGFTPLVSHLFKMMNYARHTTINAVQKLSADQLDYMQDEKSNSIGMLLQHIAAVEVWYQAFTFENRDWFADEAEAAEWGDALQLNESAKQTIRGNPVEYYIEKLNFVRRKTLEEFKKRDDVWLMEEKPFWNDLPANHYFMWFHVFEDEINHRGQIRWLRKRLPKIA